MLLSVIRSDNRGYGSRRRRLGRGCSRGRGSARGRRARLVRSGAGLAGCGNSCRDLSLCGPLVYWNYSAGFLVGDAGFGAVGAETNDLAAVGFLAQSTQCTSHVVHSLRGAN